MDLYILDATFKKIGLIDTASSVIWTERLYETGDFEIYIQASIRNAALLKKDYYVMREDRDMVGIIENVTITTDEESGDYIKATGRDLKSILSRRIVWQQTNLYGKVEMALRQLISENIINPSITSRKIENLKLGEIRGYSDTFEMQTTGDNLLDKVIELCQAYEIGWKVTLENNTFIVDFFRGADRSYSQSVNPYVVFSPSFENLLSTEYEEDITNMKNVALVAGEGEGILRTTTTVGNASGLARRELFVDANDISSNEGEISATDYANMLTARGKEKLEEAAEVTGFSGSVETGLTYKLNEDYFIGDTVQVENEYGITASTKILEIIESEDESGYTVIPTFEEWR